MSFILLPERRHGLVLAVRRREVLVVVDPEAAAVGPVDGQLGADGAPEEGAGGHAQRLAHHVQQGVLDGRDGLRERARGLVTEVKS